MQKGAKRLALAALFLGVAGSIFAQGLPTTQPNYLYIVREEVKIGRSAEHEKLEAGWPAAYEKAKSTDYYVAFESITGPSEAWFVAPYDSHAALGETMKREDTDPVLSAELNRLSRADAEHVNSVRVIFARGRKDLSHGAFPDIGKVRFSEISWFRVRPGHEAGFEAAAKAYGAAAQRSAPNVAYRVYEIIAGAPSPTYLVFSSVSSFAEFDQMMAAGDKVMTSFTPQEGAAMQSFFKEGLINFETHRFRINPVMSYVPKETRAEDPDFWMPKKPAAKTSQD
jgi:hypothetical protein